VNKQQSTNNALNLLSDKTMPNNHKKLIYPVVNHIYDENGKRQTLDALRKSTDHERWERALSNEWGRLAQGNIHQVQPTDTIEFI